MPFIPVPRIWKGVATVGKAFFGALPMVAHFFIIRMVRRMRNKKTKEKETPSSEIDATIEGLSHLLESRCYSIYRLEQMLIKSFDDKQERICREIHRYKNEYNQLLEQYLFAVSKKNGGKS